MMKSYATYYKDLYSSVLDDIADRYPSLRESLMLDKARLLSLVDARGLKFLTIDLPELGKHFERCLSNSLYVPSRLPGSRPVAGKVGLIPRLFSGIYLRVFDEFGALRVDLDIHAIACLRQLFLMAKKTKLECEDARKWQAISEFFGIDRGLRRPSLDWEADDLGAFDSDHLHLGDHQIDRSDPRQPVLPGLVPEVADQLGPDSIEWGHICSIQSVCDIVASTLGVFNPLEWRTKHGPGAVADGRKGESKYDFPYWPSKLDAVFPLPDFAYANYGLWADDTTTQDGTRKGFRHLFGEPPSRLLAVPKTQKGPRLIAAEPSCYQWCQQSIKDFLAGRIGSTPIASSVRFRTQLANQKLAQRASHDGRAATIDLSSASDRVSCWIVERAFRRNQSLLRALHASRTRWVSQLIDDLSPRYYVLKKFATMGSACTFPVQTILFTCIVVGSVLYARRLTPNIRNIRMISREVQVFGDDIIAPSTDVEPVLAALIHFGFKVNANKTFVTGRFRESCGVDAYGGVNVTPTYVSSLPVRSGPESIAAAVAQHNNLVREGWWRTAKTVRKTVELLDKRLRIPEIDIDSGLFGWKTWGVPDNTHLKRRVCRKTHQVTFLCHVLRTRQKRMSDRFSARLLQYFTEAPEPTTKWVSGVPGRPKVLLDLRWEGLAWGG